MTRLSGTILAGERRSVGRGAGTAPRKRVIAPRLISGHRPDEALGDSPPGMSPLPRLQWLAAMVRGLDALEFLERSRELAAEVVVATPARPPTR